MKIDLTLLEICIKKRYHAFGKYFDHENAEKDYQLNLEMLDRFKNDLDDKEDQESALSIINEYGKCE